MKTFDRITKCFASSAHVAVALLILIPFSVLASLSLVSTAVMSRDNSASELITFVFDNVFVNLTYLIVVLALFCAIAYLFGKISVKSISLLVPTAVLCLSVIWIATSLSAPTWDSLFVTEAGYKASNGDLSYLDQDYFRQYPFQLGYVLYNELISRVFDLGGNYIVMQVFNAIELAVIYYLLISIVSKLSHSEAAQRLCAVLLLFAAAPIMFVTFTYGIIPGLMFTVLAIWLLLKYYENGKIPFAALSALSMGLACMLKMNYLIAAVAISAVVFLQLINRRKLKQILTEAIYIVLVFVLSIGLQQLAIRQYEIRGGIDFGDGIPMTGWLAMGLSESVRAPGWYNGTYTVGAFNKANGDKDKASEIAIEEIKQRLELFDADKNYRNKFFTEKFLSQWNETTYQSIWNNQVRGQYGNKTFIAALVCGDGEDAAARYCDIYAQLIFVSIAIYMLTLIKRRFSHLELILPVTVFGGMLYHLLFEAKSQYALPYFILMIPLAAIGIERAFTYLHGKLLSKAAPIAAQADNTEEI